MEYANNDGAAQSYNVTRLVDALGTQIIVGTFISEK